MIPKIIHYCWFGRGEKPDIVKECIASWKKYCPDFRIMEWNEDNFDVDACRFSREAYAARKWAFAADYARLAVLYDYGGFYLDTDMQLFAPLAPFADEDGVLGFESRDYVAAGVIGATPGEPFIGTLKNEYETASFIKEDGMFDTLSNVHKMKRFLVEGGLKENGKKQQAAGFTIYPKVVFYPNTFGMLFGRVPKKAVAVHHAVGSWRGGGKRSALRSYLVGAARDVFGTDFLERLKGTEHE